ncbi:hypothetical protein DFH06DRAFT_1408050 [Mycena polygramma]|nr:hypothetical protein DFH06DRAFT_1408050 [Mycena polygramma]
MFAQFRSDPAAAVHSRGDVLLLHHGPAARCTRRPRACAFFVFAPFMPFSFLIVVSPGLRCSWAKLSSRPPLLVPWASVAATELRPRHRRPVLPILDVPELPLLGHSIYDERRAVPSTSRCMTTYPCAPSRTSAAALKPKLVVHTVCIAAVFEIGMTPEPACTSWRSQPPARAADSS